MLLHCLVFIENVAMFILLGKKVKIFLAASGVGKGRGGEGCGKSDSFQHNFNVLFSLCSKTIIKTSDGAAEYKLP